jgi:hypothetical protein
MMRSLVIDISEPHRAWGLHPWLSIDLHWKSFFSSHYDGRTLSKPSTGGSQTGPHLTHMQAVLEAHDLY